MPQRPRPVVRRVLRLLWWASTVLLLVLVARALERKVSWYLGVDQYGYLTFAADLARGRLFHRSPPLEALSAGLPPVTDVLFQSYVYDHGRVYCRYAPGFPLLLAAWIWAFGADAAHLFNPVLFLGLLLLLLAFQRRLFGCRWRAAAGVALVVLVPNSLFVWATAVLRDVPGHAAAFLGLFLLLPGRGPGLRPGRVAGAGLALGFAASIRPDAVLYLPSAALVGLTGCLGRVRPARARVVRVAAAGALGLVIGLSPSLAYNWAVTGNPLRSTQGMELESTPPAAAAPTAGPGVGYPPPAWRGGTAVPVQGGGLRLANLSRTLPGNLLLLRLVYGDVLLGVAIWGAFVALLRRRPLVLAAVPYVALALLFFSCWPRPAPRYLAGVHLFLPLLVVEGVFGTLDLVRRLARTRRSRLARGLAVAAAVALVAAMRLAPAPLVRGALPVVALLVPALGAAALLAAAAWPRRRVAAVAAPLLALSLVGVASVQGHTASQPRAAFQRPEMVRARATLEKALAPGAVVIASEDVGRPAENIDYYSGVAHALYGTDLLRWRLPLAAATRLFTRAGLVPYLLVTRDDPNVALALRGLRASLAIDLVAEIPPADAIAYFVASPYHGGVPLQLYRLAPKEQR